MSKVKKKTNKAVKSRFKVTGTGKLMRNKQGRRHLLTKKSAKRKRRLAKKAVLDETYQKTYAHLVGAS